jgi:hypothetical protein
MGVTRCALAAGIALLGCAPWSPKATRHAGLDPHAPAHLYVYRPEKGFLSPNQPLPVDVDRLRLAALGRDEFVSVTLPPGEHQLAVPTRPIRIVLHPGVSTYCRITFLPNQVAQVWQLACGEDRALNGDIESCGRAVFDAGHEWKR